MSGIKAKTSLLIKLLQNEIQNWIHFKYTNATSKDLIEDLKRDGYAVIENFYSAEKCNAIKESIEKTIENYPEVLWVDDAKSDYRIFGAERASSLTNEFFKDKKLQSLGEQLLKVHLVNHMTLAAKLEYKKDNAGSGGGWHRDSPFENQFKSILYLSDVDTTNGPYQFVKGSHKMINQFQTLGFGKKLMRFENEEVLKLASTHDLEIKTFEAKQGTLILTNTRGLHRGKPIESGCRFALTNYYTPKFRSAIFASYFKDVIKEPRKPFIVE